MAQLNERAAAAGSATPGHSSVDLTPFMTMPLDPGADGRGYTSSEARTGLQQRLQSSSQTYPTLEASPLPRQAVVMRDQARSTGVGTLHVSDRSDRDGFRSGQDFTYTENTGASHTGSRTASDTPRPRSPDPYSTGEALVPGTRYEDAHQNPFRFTGQPGSTVHAPTQGNQVVDTMHERNVATTVGSFVFRRDTYEASSVYSARPTPDGQWNVMHGSYLRRSTGGSAPSAPSAPAPSHPPDGSATGGGSGDKH